MNCLLVATPSRNRRVGTNLSTRRGHPGHMEVATTGSGGLAGHASSDETIHPSQVRLVAHLLRRHCVNMDRFTPVQRKGIT